MKVGFVGAGNMGGAILRGALKKGILKSEDTAVFGINHQKLLQTEKELGVAIYKDIAEITKACEVLLLGVKPQIFPEVLPKVAEGMKLSGEKSKEKIIVSMAAGISIDFMEKALGKECKIIRIMPNTPAQVGEAMTSVSRNKNVNDSELEKVMQIFLAIGKSAEVPEELIHCVIGVSGSSPAYTYMYIDALARAAVENGMTYEQGLDFAAQAVLGAAKMVLETGINPEILCKNVCSPGGTTIEAVNLLKERGFEELVCAGFQATVDKSKSMSK